MVRIAIIVVALPFIAVGCANEPVVQLSDMDLYLDYCASCHGANGESNGPVASVIQAQFLTFES